MSAQPKPIQPRLSGAARIAAGVLGFVGLAAIVIQTFNLSIASVFPLLSSRYYYVLIALFLSAVPHITTPAFHCSIGCSQRWLWRRARFWRFMPKLS